MRSTLKPLGRSFSVAAVVAVLGACPDSGPERPRPAEGNCFIDDDCDTGELCFSSSCYRDEACQNNEPDCPTDCEGFCSPVPFGIYCETDDDCLSDTRCHFDERFCLEDRRPSGTGACVGWCRGGCFLVETYALAPDGQCFRFSSCAPPGFARPSCEECPEACEREP